MGTVKVTNIEPIADNGTLTIGNSGDTIALTSGAKTSGFGKIGQVVIKTSTTNSSNSSTTFANTNLTNANITPTSTSSKILVMCNQLIQSYNSGGSYGTGRWKVVRTVSSTDTSLNNGGDSTNGNIFNFDYGGSGINVFKPFTLMFLDEPATTNQVSYRTQIAKGSNGGTLVQAYDGLDDGKFILMEILD